MKCKCGGVMGIEIEDATTARAVCHLGHSHYMFRLEDGTWETAEERKIRMNKYRVCEICEKGRQA